MEVRLHVGAHFSFFVFTKCTYLVQNPCVYVYGGVTGRVVYEASVVCG